MQNSLIVTRYTDYCLIKNEDIFLDPLLEQTKLLSKLRFLNNIISAVTFFRQNLLSPIANSILLRYLFYNLNKIRTYKLSKRQITLFLTVDILSSYIEFHYRSKILWFTKQITQYQEESYRFV